MKSEHSEPYARENGNMGMFQLGGGVWRAGPLCTDSHRDAEWIHTDNSEEGR